jgi:uncharacterized protein (DUF302 family)
VGQQMLEHRDQYSGFMPCRIALVEESGKLWLGGHDVVDAGQGGLESR